MLLNSTIASAEPVPSYYAATAPALKCPGPLKGEISADVCVVGGGYTGVSSALHLAERGYRVALLEANTLGWGASGRNGGHVGVGQRRDQGELERRLGADRAGLLWRLGLDAVDLVLDRIKRHQIECDLKHGILHVAAKPSHVADLEADTRLLRQSYDYRSIAMVNADETQEMIGSDRYFGGQMDAGSCHLHPLKYLRGLARAARDAGADLFEGSRVTRVVSGERLRIETAEGHVNASYLVLGCNGYLERLMPAMARRIMPINNFILATEPLDSKRASALIRDDVAVQDSLFVINYWKLSGDNRLLFGGGENYSRRFPADIAGFVRRYLLKVYPQLEQTRIDYAWGGTLAVTTNRLPSFGRIGPNILYAQGFSGHGIPTASLAGQLLAEAVAGTAERFDIMAQLPVPEFPGGMLLRWPALVLGMLYYTLRDRL